MTTASLLESITDRSRFELLATSVLRKANLNYSAIIHTGINAAGETIVSPVDGFHFLDRWFASHQTLRGLMIAAEFLKHVGTRKDLDLLSRYSISAEGEMVEKVRGDAEFAVRRRSLL